MAATDLLRTRRDVSELEGRQSNDQEAIARIQAELREADLQLEGQSIHFRQEALAELTQKQAELAVVRESMRAAADRVANTDMRSPVSGIVNTLYVNTVGGFVNAGTRVMDIVPVEEQLLVEAKVRPQDIAFIHPGQRATVKVTAYDFSIYGGLDGEVEQVSASSVYDEASRETFYTVLVKTEKSTLARNGVENPILPGHDNHRRHSHRREERPQLSVEADQQGPGRSASRALSAGGAMSRDRANRPARPQ